MKNASFDRALVRRVWSFARAYRLMLLGFLVTIVADALCFGERQDAKGKLKNGEYERFEALHRITEGKTLQGKYVWDARRALDYLETRAEGPNAREEKLAQVRALAAAPGSAGLRHLALSGFGMDGEGLRAILGSPRLGSLRSLRLERDLIDDAAAKQLAAQFWPGPLTLVLQRSAQAKDFVTGGQDSVGLRVPSHPMAHSSPVRVGTRPSSCGTREAWTVSRRSRGIRTG